MIGTSTVKAYMHGFFIDLRLYEKAKAITNPFDYDNFRRQQIQTKIEKERSTRIGTLKKLPKINKNLAQKLLTSEELADKKKKSKSGREGVTEENPTGDNRFKDLFVDADYEVDEAGVEYRLRHPAVVRNLQK